MKAFLFFLLVSTSLLSCEAHSHIEKSEFQLNVVEFNSLRFFTDPEKITLSCGLEAVFPYADEGKVLLELARKIRNDRKAPFDVVIDPFCGDGKSSLPIVQEGIAKECMGSDINPRAVEFARFNAHLNRLEKKCQIAVGDVKKGIKPPKHPSNRLWVANPPFVLRTKGAPFDRMSYGGENGLEFILSFIKEALSQAVEGDVIVGIGYSRIHKEGKIELDEEIKKILPAGTEYKLTLLEGEKVWRGFSGKKEQPNPMIISGETFALKANPYKPEEIEAYRTSAEFHIAEGYTQLGYFAYHIFK